MFKFNKLTGVLIGVALGGPVGGAIGYGLGKIVDKSLSQPSTYSNKIGKLSYGDIIYINRELYKHFGVYCNDNSVIHYSSLESDTSSDNMVIETDINTFKRGDSGVYKLIFPESYNEPTSVLTDGFVENKRDDIEKIRRIKSLKYHLYSPTETVNRAMSRLGENLYDLFSNNCEHFAIWCKTGISESHQINRILESPELNTYINY